MAETAPQREHSLRAVLNGLRWIARTGAHWRMMPNALPPWHTVSQQPQRWLRARVFETMVHDLRVLIRVATGRNRQPTATIFDARTVQSTAFGGERAGYDGHKRRNGSKPHRAGDTLGLLLAVHVTPANEQARAQVIPLAQAVHEATGNTGEVAVVDHGSTGAEADLDAAVEGIRVEVVTLPEAKRGWVVLPRRWVVERRFAWMAQFRRLARDYERLPETVAGLHFVAFACLMLHRVVPLLTQSA